MKEEYQEKSYGLFWGWMLLLAVGLAAYSCFPKYFGTMSAGKTVGLLTCAALDLLFLLIYLTERVYWISGVTYEEASAAGRRARKQFALRQLAVFLAVTAVFLLYCFWLSDRWRTGGIWDSIVAGGVICLGTLAGRRIKL